MRVIGKSLYGSQNYHLDGPQSDKDYKIFMAPEFIDLYNGKDKPALPMGYNPDFVSAMDFRKFDNLLRRGNVNTIEYLFSSEFELYDDNFNEYFITAHEAFEKGYLTHVWDYFFSSVKGLILNTVKRLNFSNEARRKAASRGIWWINFVSFVIKHDYCIREEMWKLPAIYNFPREIRFNGDIDLPNEEDWQEMFEYLEILAANTKCSIADFLHQGYDNLLAKCAQDTIAAAIKRELECR